MRRARRQLTGPLAVAGVLLAVGCSRPADAVPTGRGDAAPAPATAAAPGAGRASAGRAPAAAARTPPAASTTTPATAAAGGGADAACPGVPLAVRVAAVRRASADSVRIDLVLINRASADARAPGSPALTAARAAVEALDGASVLSADGRRRMFALRDASGERVGPPAPLPEPGRTEAFWRLFPASEGRLTLLLPGCAPLTGLVVSPGAVQPEP